MITSITRHNVAFPFKQLAVTSGNSEYKGVSYAAANVTKENLSRFITWLGEDEVVDILSSVMAKRGWEAHKVCAEYGPDEKTIVGVDEQKLRECHEQQSTSEESLSSIKTRLEELRTQTLAAALVCVTGSFSPDFPDKEFVENLIRANTDRIQQLETVKNNTEEERAEKRKLKKEAEAAAAASKKAAVSV